MTQRNILLTYALIYANGPAHLGHMLGYVQTDIWARFQRMRGHRCYYVCGSDTHGTPIMLKAQEQNMSPEAMVKGFAEQQLKDFEDFGVQFDSFMPTNTLDSQQLVEKIYHALNDNGDIQQREIEQAFDDEKQLFLPDRFLKGTCPRCKTEDQYGDSCEQCGATYSSKEIINPISTLSGTTPSYKKSQHFFFSLRHYQDKLEQWIEAGHLQPEVANKLKEWFEGPLQDWDISRDAPYYGFEIPNAPGKYFYVWLDAPIGYLSSFAKLCQDNNLNFDDFWKPDNNTEVHHFLGKDIIYFHALFWPAVLMGAGYRTPTQVRAHGFLTFNGKKLSKSRGTLITARQYLDVLGPDYLRYYFAAKLGDKVEDIDLNLEDFRLRVNADLVGKVVNIASRCAGFLRKKFDNQMAAELLDPELFAQCQQAADSIANDYENCRFRQAVRTIMALADDINRFIETHKPWELAKQEGQEEQVHLVCSQGINLFRLLMIYLRPIVPMMVEKAEQFLNVEPLCWDDLNTPLLSHQLNKFKPLLNRVEAEQLESLVV